MAYNNMISRSEAQPLIPEVVSDAILGGLQNESVALTMFRQTRMATNETRMPVLAALPNAYFVNGDTGLKQTTEVNWSNKYLDVQELAAIVPIPEAVLADVQMDVWGNVKPLVEQSIGRTLDAAIFFGTNKPSIWPNAIVTDAASAGNTVTRGTNAAAAGGITGDFSDLYATVEADGFDVNGLIAGVGYKGRLRQARTTQGEPLLVPGAGVWGVTPRYPMRGQWPTGSGSTEAVAGDFTQGMIGIRQDMTWKVLDQAVIQDGNGAIQYNLPQQDMVALRVVFRVAFQVANTLNYDQPNSTSRYPFAILVAP
jgi:HK97 family phage major capsid protein